MQENSVTEQRENTYTLMSSLNPESYTDDYNKHNIHAT